MSSCPNASDEEEFRVKREGEVRDKVRAFLKTVALNLASLEGMSGTIDVAFKIDRQRIIAEVLVELGTDMLNEYNLAHEPRNDVPTDA